MYIGNRDIKILLIIVWTILTIKLMESELYKRLVYGLFIA